MSKHIKIKTKGNSGEEDDSNFDYYFPMFVFALRDFTLLLEVDGEEVTSDEYLEHCLKLRKELSDNDKVIIVIIMVVIII